MCSDMTSTNIAPQMSVSDGSQWIQLVFMARPYGVYILRM